MDYLKDKKRINNVINELMYCTNSDDFYRLTTKLYYRLNSLIYNLESKNLKLESDSDV